MTVCGRLTIWTLPELCGRTLVRGLIPAHTRQPVVNCKERVCRPTHDGIDSMAIPLCGPTQDQMAAIVAGFVIAIFLIAIFNSLL
jgi:hypothetical protein